MIYKCIIVGLVVGLMSGCASSKANVAVDGVLVSKDEVRRHGVATVGSRIKRNSDVEDGAAPVQSYERDQMKESGATSLGEFLGVGR